MSVLWTHLSSIDSALGLAFVIGLQALALLGAGALALLLGKNQRLASVAAPVSPPWFWFACFSLGKGLAIIACLASGTTKASLPPAFFSAAFLGFSLPAWLAGIWFAWQVHRARLGLAVGRCPWAWALAALGLVAVTSGLTGLVVVNRGLAAIGGVALCLALIGAPRSFPVRRRPRVAISLGLLGTGLLGLAALEAAGPAYQNLLPGWTLPTFRLFEQGAFLPAYLGLGFAGVFAVGWWLWMRLHAHHAPSHRWLGRALWLVPVVLALTSVLGFGAVNFIKVRGAERADLAYARRAQAIVAGLDLAGWRGRDDPVGLARALGRFAVANPDIEAIAHAEMRGDRLHVLAVAASSVALPERPTLWRERGAPDPRFTAASEPFSSSFMQDAHGTFTLYCEPWPAPGRGWLVFRVNALDWSDVMGPVLVQASLIVLLGCLAALAVAFVVVQRELGAESRLDLARASAADQAKTELLTLASHELRTPIQGVLGYAELLDRSALDPRQRDWIEALRGQGDHLLRLVNDLLDFGALQTGRLALQTAPLSPARVVRSAVTAIRPLAEARGLACSLELTASVPAWVLGDATRLRQILVNLLGNAVKFTPSGEITLRVDYPPVAPGASTRPLVFSVTDTGVGIASADLPRLFEPHPRAPGRVEEGAGLGLALTRSLCLAMQGTLSVASEPGVGSTFTARVVLPETVPPPAETAPAAATAFVPPGLRVLVVEDNTALRGLIAAWLSELACAPVLVRDGESALAVCVDQEFDIVLLDLGLPGMDGLAVARHLRARATARPPRIIGLSAHAGASDRAAALDAGMDVFLAKPIELAALAAALAPHAPDRAGLLATRLLPAAQLASIHALAAGEMPALLARLRAARVTTDWIQVAATAHYLANTADVLGRAELRAACLDCEAAARAGDDVAIAVAIDRIARFAA